MASRSVSQSRPHLWTPSRARGFASSRSALADSSQLWLAVLQWCGRAKNVVFCKTPTSQQKASSAWRTFEIFAAAYDASDPQAGFPKNPVNRPICGLAKFGTTAQREQTKVTGKAFALKRRNPRRHCLVARPETSKYSANLSSKISFPQPQFANDTELLRVSTSPQPSHSFLARVVPSFCGLRTAAAIYCFIGMEKIEALEQEDCDTMLELSH